MSGDRLPAELAAIEWDLAARLPGGPADGLRGRVLGGVRTELRRQQRRAGWGFATAVAVAVVVWINLSISATRATDYHLQPGAERQSVAVVAGQIRQLVPEISPRESRRQAALLQAGSNLAWYPNFPARPAARGRLDASDNLLP